MSDCTPLKRCSKCRIEKPATPEYFSRSTKDKGGLKSRCKECQHVDSRIYRENNPEKLREKRRRYRVENPNKVREINRAYRANNKEKKREYDQGWAKRNRGRLRELGRKSYQKHGDKKRAYHRDWTKKNPDKVKVHNHRRAARKLSVADTFTQTQWNYALNYFGYCCAVCGRPLNGLFHKPAMDHWIPLASADCPGTIATNILPLCHGDDGCNNSKKNKLPSEWLVERFGKRKAKTIFNRIEEYFQVVRDKETHE